MYLQLFVFKLEQNKKIATWESNVVKIWISNAHKNLIDFLIDIFFDKGNVGKVKVR